MYLPFENYMNIVNHIEDGLRRWGLLEDVDFFLEDGH